MIKRFIPDMYQESIFTINYNKLKQNNVKKMMRDVNTIFFYNDTFYTEREVLKRYFLNKK